MSGHKVRIVTSDELSVDGTRVFIDDEEVKMVQHVDFFHMLGSVPSLTITFIPERVSIEGTALVEGEPIDEGDE